MLSGRSRAERGTLSGEPYEYGRSRLGAPLEAWLGHSARGGLVMMAGIHGEEPETTVALSSALRCLAPGQLSAAVLLGANPDGLARGTRGNAAGVDLNRNFPTADWSPDPPAHHFTRAEPQDVLLSPGPRPASEPETRALMDLLEELRPAAVIAVHSPLACVIDAEHSPLSRALAEATGMRLRRASSSPTPGTLDGWVRETLAVPAVTLELPVISKDEALVRFSPLLAGLLAGRDPGALSVTG